MEFSEAPSSLAEATPRPTITERITNLRRRIFANKMLAPQGRDDAPEVNREVAKTPLSQSENDYNSLPLEFDVSSGLNRGLEMLRGLTAQREAEVGGVLVRKTSGEEYVMEGGVGNEAETGINTIAIDDINISRYKDFVGHSLSKDYSTSVYFVPKEIADQDSAFFKDLMTMGAKVVIDSQPSADMHTHPDPHLPSDRDFFAALVRSVDAYRLRHGTSRSIIVNPDWAYLLITTKQTADIMRRGSYLEISDELERQTAEVFKDLPKADPNPVDKVNAAMLNILRDASRQYSVGFYALKRGDSTARRIV